MQTRHAALIALLVVAACKEKDGVAEFHAMEAAVAKQHSATLSARLAKLIAVQAAAQQRPALTPLQAPAAPSSANPAFLGFDEKEKLDRPWDAHEPRSGCRFFFDNGSFSKLNGAPGFWSMKEVSPTNEDRTKIDTLMKRLESATYALVCVQTAATEPKGDGPETFTGGAYKGECRVFDIESTKYLGGFPVDYQMQSAITKAYRDLNDWMKDDLRSTLDTSVQPFGKAPELSCSWD